MKNSIFEKILVPVDGSHSCLHAEEYAAMVAKSFASKVTVLHVIPHGIIDSALGTRPRLPGSVSQEIEGWLRQTGTKVLEDAQALFTEEEIAVEGKLTEHVDPAEIILETAKIGNFNLVIMGNRGTSGVEDFSLGSVAEKVSRHVDRPVLIVKKKTKTSRILIAFDGSQHAKKALQYGFQLALKHGAEITLLNVVDMRIPFLDSEAAKKNGERLLSEAVTEKRKMKVNKRVEVGHPAETILRLAKDEGYDLIVLGGRGLSKVKRFFLGSVSDRVSRHAETSVLIVK